MNVTFWVNAIAISTVFLFGCVGEIIIEKSGHLNLGIPGIMCLGTAGSCVCVYWYMSASGTNQPSYLMLVLISVLSSAFFSASGGLIYAFLTVSLRCNQNITGLALTTFGTGLAQFLIDSLPAADRMLLWQTASRVVSQGLPFASSLGVFGKLFFSHGVFVYAAIVIAVVAAIVFKRTKAGLYLRAVGENPATADACGINVKKYKYFAIIIGSAVAGLGGMFYVMDFSKGAITNLSTIEAFGWLSVSLVIFTLWNPALSIIGSLIFGSLYIISSFINVSIQVAKLIEIIPYAVTVTVLIITSALDNKKARPPQSLGLNYFREER